MKREDKKDLANKPGLLFLSAAIGIAACLVIYQVQNTKNIQNIVTDFNPTSNTVPVQSSVLGSSVKNSSVVLDQQIGKTEHATKEVAYTTPTRLTTYFAKSLEGTDIDGQLKSDVNGNLIIEREVRDVIDYFFNTVGEVSPEEALSQLEALANGSLPSSAVDDLLEVVDSYIRYKELAMEIGQISLIPKEQQTPDYQIRMLTHAFEQLKQARREAMSPELVEAFFADEEAYSEYTLSSLRINSDPSLSPQEKAEYMQTARAQLPEYIRATEEGIIAKNEKHREVYAAMSNESDERLEQKLIEEGYTAEAIEEIKAHRSQQESFDALYTQYSKQRQLIVESSLSEDDKHAQIESLRSKFFDNERELTQAKVRDLRS